ncbi:clathrin light chain A-like isoform X2 [Hypanus sabinus]|uniref:clathrin light chain A-like isoform X2 n=1 Tax=Hypanus sabinus TaxID=79690 RepID=UPI0028C4E7EA|nr:clathrin light chain A-like isoform X2 [Hypanus sabinus]
MRLLNKGTEDMDVGNDGAPGAEDPAAAFLHQHHTQIQGIETQPEGETAPEPDTPDTGAREKTDEVDAVPGDSSQENIADVYAAISEADDLYQEPDSIRRWREEQMKHLEALDANSREAELEWREKARKELEDWNTQQEEHLEEMKTNNRILDEAFYKQPFADVIGYVTNIKQHCYNLQQTEDTAAGDVQEIGSGSDWERVLHLCDLNSKTSKPSKDVSRMRSVLLSLSQLPVALK